MNKYKSIWLSRTDFGKVLVHTKAGIIYIADSKEEAIEQALKRRNGFYPIYLIDFRDGHDHEEQVA